MGCTTASYRFAFDFLKKNSDFVRRGKEDPELTAFIE